jgi:DNA recombination protein RmuC
VTALLTLAAFAVGAVLSWIILWGRGAGAAERLRSATDRASQLEAELLAERSQRTDAASRAARVEGELTAEKAAAAARLAELSADHEALANKFSKLSSEALAANSTAFLTLAQETFNTLREQSAGDLETRRQAIESLVKPLGESLEKVNTAVADIERKRENAYGTLGQQIATLTSAHQLSLDATNRLSTSLSTTRTAGTWGELQLRRVVELAGMLEHCDFTEQPTHGGDEGRVRPDLVVALPGGQRIAVDAKAPTEAFREAAVETNAEARLAKLAEHAAKVRGHVDALSSREYWAKMQPSPEYVVLFLPGDSFLSAAIESDPAIMDRAISKKVLLATPMTLIALLKAAAYGWEQEKFSRNADEVKKAGRELYDRIVTFSDHMDSAGKGLASAVRNFNSAVGSFEGTLEPGARKLAELGSKGVKDYSRVSPVEVEVRQLAKR